MKKAVFLDRDGVMNKELGHYVVQRDDFVVLSDLYSELLELQNAGFIFIVISNQGGIAKQLYSKKFVEELHNSMLAQLNDAGIEITEVYYCPHHPDYGRCICRKPDSLLIEKAMARFNINPAESFFVGDTSRDIEAATKSGLTGIRITPNEIRGIASKILITQKI